MTTFWGKAATWNCQVGYKNATLWNFLNILQSAHIVLASFSGLDNT